jgi:hypothetical protein
MSTARQARNSRFQRGSGVYTCRSCGHDTRDTGGDGSGVRLCDTCYELAGEVNHMSDNGGETYGTHDEVRAMLAYLDKRSAGNAQRVFPELCTAVGYPAKTI